MLACTAAAMTLVKLRCCWWVAYAVAWRRRLMSLHGHCQRHDGRGVKGLSQWRCHLLTPRVVAIPRLARHGLAL